MRPAGDFFLNRWQGFFIYPFRLTVFLSYASLCRHEGLAVVTSNAIFPRMRTRAIQPKWR